MKTLDLDNIIVKFNTEEINSLYEGKIYNIPFISNLTALKAEFASYYDLTVERAVVQLKEVQYGIGAVARIVSTYQENGRDVSQIVNLTIIATEQPTFYQALRDTRAEIETEIIKQLNV
jgi:hypothetical protein